tara:strand:+ start:473 stop:847 length:375 start_codon:yes stop_codon:yes gene_type:complete
MTGEHFVFLCFVYEVYMTFAYVLKWKISISLNPNLHFTNLDQNQLASLLCDAKKKKISQRPDFLARSFWHTNCRFFKKLEDLRCLKSADTAGLRAPYIKNHRKEEIQALKNQTLDRPKRSQIVV